jgi:hypothetical protein
MRPLRSLYASRENSPRSRRANTAAGLTRAGSPTRLRGMRLTRWLALGVLALGAAALAEESGTPPHIYRWIDENGIAHYTTSLERVPEELRGAPLRHEEASAQAPVSVDTWVQRERVPDPPQPDAGASNAGASDRLTAVNARIAELEQAIETDEALLKGDLTDANAPASNDALKEVAERMPDRIAELKKLQAERDALATPAAQ